MLQLDEAVFQVRVAGRFVSQCDLVAVRQSLRQEVRRKDAGEITKGLKTATDAAKVTQVAGKLAKDAKAAVRDFKRQVRRCGGKGHAASYGEKEDKEAYCFIGFP